MKTSYVTETIILPINPLLGSLGEKQFIDM